MTIQEFINKYNNKYVEVVDSNALFQCFDLALQWCIGLGIPKTIFPFYNAYQIYINFSTAQAQYFIRVPNSAANSPKEGDIVVLANNYNFAGGHVGIASGKGSASGSYNDWFEMFSQNDPFRSPSHLSPYKYNYIVGWLHPKNYNPTPVLTSDQLIQTIKNKINTNIGDTEYRQWERKLLGVG